MPTTSAASGTWATTARLLRRAGFGATGAEVDAADRLGAGAWLEQALRADPAADPAARSTPPPSIAPLQRAGKGATREQRQAVNRTVAASRKQLLGWWLQRMATTGQPLTEKLTFGWHDHFATDVHKVRDARLMLAQNATLRRLGRGSFTDLARALAVDPAMLVWLDGRLSTAKAPNENLAREFMELFALGHGNGYTEQDVREGARALTGWTVDGTSARFVARRHDDGSKTVLGRTGDLDTDGYVDAVLAAPASAGFVATRWWQRLVSPTPPGADRLAALTAAYGPRRDLTALFRGLLTTVLDDPSVAGTLVVTPVEWTVGAVRALRVPLGGEEGAKHLALVTSTLNQLGQVPFSPPNVSGWPSGQAWLSTAAAQNRLEAATRLAAAGDLDAVASAPQASRVDAVAHLLAIPTLTDRTVVGLRAVASDPRRLVAAALVSPEYLTA
ncbi:DUF1800 domain-containing protein [Lapillicoccus jejuensis]|uniref:Uncharacterized protein (DUF1800 family) n=1 Tax=Lapillicoccus jejuensis TaxID=402171 RepID=A0A542E6P3_9MICO|nr:DUF1800 domain-containing protein [Lapillicoccus jejuensis]TQJ11001.1 uncharacterized protein (DUF1800 family) [Lapillicoccus jejuensis]